MLGSQRCQSGTDKTQDCFAGIAALQTGSPSVFLACIIYIMPTFV
jgi:hypothetical protein